MTTEPMSPERGAYALETAFNQAAPYSDPDRLQADDVARLDQWLDVIAERAAAVMPTIEPNVRIRILWALLSASDDDERYSAIVTACDAAGVPIAEALAHADIMADMFTQDRGYYSPDTSLDIIPPEPFDPTWSRPRLHTERGLEVRGSRNGYIIGADGDDRPCRMSYREALQRADMWQHFAHPRGEVLPLIGTDEYDWHEVTPPLGLSHHMGDSVTAEARHARHYVPRWGTYSRGPVRDYRADKIKAQSAPVGDYSTAPAEVAYLHGIGTARVVKRYRTVIRERIGTDENGRAMFGRRVMIGHRTVNRTATKARTATKIRHARPVEVDSVDTLLAQAENYLSDTAVTRAAWTLPNGCRVTITRRTDDYSVVTINAAGIKRQTTRRKNRTVIATITNALR